MLERLRTIIGAKIVQLGIRVAGFEVPNQPSDEDDDEGAIGDATCPPVEFSDRALEMIQEGASARPPTRLPSVRSDVLTGSAADRFRKERTNALNSLRSKG